MTLFPFSEFWHWYLGFGGFVVVMLALDLGVFHKKAHEVSFKEASIWTLVWMSLALVFALGIYVFGEGIFSAQPHLMAMPGFDPKAAAERSALEFLTGFVVEKSLAVDNIFVFAVVFSFFGIPRIYQHRILFYGVLGALFFRAAFVALGSYLMQYHAVLIFFGVFLIITGLKMFLAPDKMMDPEKNFVLKLMNRFLRVSPKLDGDKFFTRKNGLLYATPLFVALVFLEISDIIFAVDSVPAIFALTKEPFLVFTSNVFAILGLRSMFFLLAGVMDRFAYIKYGLASVLVFVGVKMAWLNDLFDGKFPIGWSLGIIVLLIGGSILASWLWPREVKLASDSV